MRPVRAEVEVWHLSLRVPGQHSTLASNLRLRREGGSQPLLLKWLATFPSCFIFLKRNLTGKLGLVGARGRWSSLALCEPRCGPQFRTIAPSYLQLSQRRAMRRCSFMPLVGAPRWVGARALKSCYPIWMFHTLISLCQHKKVGKRSRTDEADSEEDSSPVMYGRFFVIKSSSAERTISKLSPFALEKSLKAAIGTAKGVKRLWDGNILVEVASAADSQNIMKL